MNSFETELRGLKGKFHELDVNEVMSFQVGDEGLHILGGVAESQYGLAKFVAVMRKIWIQFSEPSDIAESEYDWRIGSGLFRNGDINQEINEVMRLIEGSLLMNKIPEWYMKKLRMESYDNCFLMSEDEEVIEIVFQNKTSKVYFFWTPR